MYFSKSSTLETLFQESSRNGFSIGESVKLVSSIKKLFFFSKNLKPRTWVLFEVRTFTTWPKNEVTSTRQTVTLNIRAGVLATPERHWSKCITLVMDEWMNSIISKELLLEQCGWC